MIPGIIYSFIGFFKLIPQTHVLIPQTTSSLRRLCTSSSVNMILSDKHGNLF